MHVPINKNKLAITLNGLEANFLDFKRAKNPIGGKKNNNAPTNAGESYQLSVLLVLGLSTIVLYFAKRDHFIISQFSRYRFMQLTPMAMLQWTFKNTKILKTQGDSFLIWEPACRRHGKSGNQLNQI